MIDLKAGDRVKSTISEHAATVIESNPEKYKYEVKVKFDGEAKAVWYGTQWLVKIQ